MARQVVVVVFAGLALTAAGLGVYSLLVPGSSPDPIAEPPPPPPPSAGGLPSAGEFDQLAASDPVRLLQACLTRYRQDVPTGFVATLEKQERVRGTLFPPEVIRLAVRDRFPADPAAPPAPQVRMIWQSGLRKAGVFGLDYEVRGTLLADGKTIEVWRPDAPFNKKFLAAANDEKARESSRYCICDAGLYSGMHRTYRAWHERQKAGELRTEYLGKQSVEKAGGRLCHVIRRICPRPEVDGFELGGQPPTDPAVVERDGFTEVTIMIDAERWLQVGTRITRADVDPPRLVGEYYFRDVDLSPTFTDATFTFDGMMADAEAR